VESESDRMTIKQIAYSLARKLRRNQTAAESVLWKVLRNKQWMNCKFHRQHPVFYTYQSTEKFFIADFYCRRLKLIIEIDGGIHEKQSDYDQIRSDLLSIQHELKIIRFTNEEIIDDTNGVILKLRRILIR
jgi:very-short-patch-repair endonuclease